jgi:peptidoglycan/xylan/chitin deacetylase (PgdA/CDA1 family)
VNATGAAANLGALARLAATRRAAGGAAVLGYHDVVADAERTAEHHSVTADQLRSHIRLLRRLGLRIAPLAELVAMHRAGTSLDGLAALTFDDALVGVHDHALEVLDDERTPATVFVVTDAVGVAPPWWPGSARTMTSDELRTVAAAGVSLAAHSSRHASLPSLGDDELTDDLTRSRARVAALDGGDPDVLAYPFGHHDARVRAAARAAGFTAALTFLNGRARPDDDAFRLPRLTAHRGLRSVTLARHLGRSPDRWPDHQADRVLDGGPAPATSAREHGHDGPPGGVDRRNRETP